MAGATYFSWVNAIDTASLITTSSEEATLPGSNLMLTKKGRVWRTVGTTSAYFIANFAAATSINVLALGGATLSDTDTVRHRLYDAANATGTLLLDVSLSAGVLPDYALHVYQLAAALSPLSWKCDISAASRGSYNYFDIKRAWAGPHWNPAVGMSRPFERGWNDDADKQRARRSGAVFVGDGPRYRRIGVNLDWMADADVAQYEELCRVAGVRNQVLCIPDSGGVIAREAILGRLDQITPARASKDVIPPVYETNFQITQDL